MRERIIAIVAGVIGLAIGIYIGDVFGMSRVTAKIVALGCAAIAAFTVLFFAAVLGFIKSEVVPEL